GLEVLCLASGGGQQAPVFAAAGANVTVLDASPAQLARDREVAEREGLAIKAVQGDMADLSAFPDGTFALVFHPCSNCFVQDVRPVWRVGCPASPPRGAVLSRVSYPPPSRYSGAPAARGGSAVRPAPPPPRPCRVSPAAGAGL